MIISTSKIQINWLQNWPVSISYNWFKNSHYHQAQVYSCFIVFPPEMPSRSNVNKTSHELGKSSMWSPVPVSLEKRPPLCLYLQDPQKVALQALYRILGWIDWLGYDMFPGLVGSSCSYLLPKQDGWSSQIQVNPTQLRDHQNHPVVYVVRDDY